jgi:hypothetical protein
MASTRPSALDAPPLSLRGGNALDDGLLPPQFDAQLDQPTPEYFEANHCGISYLDPVSWRYYLPLLSAYALQKLSHTNSLAIESFLSSLRPPDREPPRLESLTPDQRAKVVELLDRLAFDDASVWKSQAITALEEYWAPGALYRASHEA